MPTSAVLATGEAMPAAPFLPAEKPFLLIDVYRTLPEHDRADFRATAKDFASGLNATIEGARRAMRQWVKKPPSWISPAWQARRIRFLAIFETLE